MGLPDASPPGDEENCRRTSGVHTSAPGFRPRMIVLGSPWFPMPCVSLGTSGGRRSCCIMGKTGQNQNSLTSVVKETSRGVPGPRGSGPGEGALPSPAFFFLCGRAGLGSRRTSRIPDR